MIKKKNNKKNRTRKSWSVNCAHIVNALRSFSTRVEGVTALAIAGSNSDLPRGSRFLGADQRDRCLWEKDWPTWARDLLRVKLRDRHRARLDEANVNYMKDKKTV